MSRYVVTEIEGFATMARQPSRQGNGGLSVHVLDAAYGYRIVATFRTEDYSSWVAREARRDLVRELAAARCGALNRLDEIARAVA